MGLAVLNFAQSYLSVSFFARLRKSQSVDVFVCFVHRITQCVLTLYDSLNFQKIQRICRENVAGE